MKQENLFDTNYKKSWFEEALVSLNVDEIAGWPDKFGDQFFKWLSSNQSIKIKTLSLFSGGGGLDIAFHDMGFDIVECVEIEKNFTATLVENSKIGRRLAGSRVLCMDIKDYSPEHKNIQFIIGGPPCQTFSAAGARASGVNGIDDKRGTLFEEYVRIVKQTKPVGFLFENVYRIIGAQGGTPWKLIQEAFRSVGYTLFWRIIDAADYGVPQHRERLIIVGLRDNGEFKFPRPSHGPDSSDSRLYYNAGLAVSGLDTSQCEIGINGRHGHLLNEIPPGLNYSYYTDRMGHPKPIFGWRSKFSDYLYKADPKTPVRTIKAQGGQYTGPFSWENRHFTVDETKRLQTFPDNYLIKGGYQTVIHQLGNSVPPQVGRILAASILNQVFAVKLPFNIEYMSNSQSLGFRKRKSSLTEVYKEKANNKIKQKLSDQCNEKHKTEIPISGLVTLYLSKEFKLSNIETSFSTKFDFSFSFTKTKWKIICKSEDGALTAYSIGITLTLTQQNSIGTKKIELESNRESKESLLALWKYLEQSINSYAHKDDLIQLFGYYQYRQSSKISMLVKSKKLQSDHFWHVVSLVTNGVCVAETLHINKLCELLESDENSLKLALETLKRIGFEIRNHNTNNQIKEDYYLIPYAFPTLNERSLQRLTAL